MIRTGKQLIEELNTLPPAERDIAAAILKASSVDEIALIDHILKEKINRRFNPADIIYVDLSIDRSSAPLEISGAGTLIAGLEATDNNSSCSISLETPDADTNRRFTIVRGKRIKLPFGKFYVYHAAQAGKYIKLLRAVSLPSFQFGVEDDSGADANSDLVQSLGNSSSFTTGQISVANTSTVIKALNLARKRITIKNPSGGAAVYIGLIGVTTGTGHLLNGGDAFTFNTTAAVYGIVGSGTQTVTYLEE